MPQGTAKYMMRMLAAVAFVAAIVAGFGVFKNMMIKKAILETPKVFTVSTAKTERGQWQDEITALGTLKAVKGAELAVETGGVVDAVYLQSGAEVEEGTLLVQLKTAEDMARLRALQAEAKLAEVTLERDRKQLNVQAISQAAVDAASARLEQAKAQVAQQRAAIEKKVILAPFSGRVGIIKADVGQYVAAGSPVVTLQQVDPLHVDFILPQQEISKLAVGGRISVTSDAFPSSEFVGEITIINPKVDADTRNVSVRASLSNPDKTLLPGMYVTAKVLAGEPKDVLLVPRTAITKNPYGSTVYVVEESGNGESGEDEKDKAKPKLIAAQRFVETGASRKDMIVITSGLKEGETVVTAGQIKLRNGVEVAINNEVAPKVAPYVP